jgi:hypothetical protein
MALFDELNAAWLPSVFLGVGAALLAPAILPALSAGIRPLTKAVVKGGLMVTDMVREVVSEAGEQFSDLVAEARAEMATTNSNPVTAAVGEKTGGA